MSRCAWCEDSEGPIRVSYWNNDNLQYPISVQVCSPCCSVLQERGMITEADIHEDAR